VSSNDVIVDVDYDCQFIRPKIYVFIQLSIICNELLRNVFLSIIFGSGRTIVGPLHIFTYMLTQWNTFLLEKLTGFS